MVSPSPRAGRIGRNGDRVRPDRRPVAVAIITASRTLGTQISATFNAVAGAMTNA
jgi:hypothetical protein